MIVRRLTEDEAINSFCCGDADLDDFIINESMLYSKSLLSVNYIMEEYDNPVAFFSLLNDKISIHEFDNKTNFNRFRSHKFVNKKRIQSYPAVSFYEKDGFVALHNNDDDSFTRLMYFDLVDYKNHLK